MDNEVIYNELVRQYEEGNNADNTINKKIDFLLLVSVAFIGYFFTVDNFLQIPIKGSLLVKHIFGAGIISLIISLFYTFKAFLLMKYKRGLKIDKVEMVVKKHPQILVYQVLNFALKNAIKYNYEKQKTKNKYFFKGFILLLITIFFFILAKILFLIP